MEQILYYVKLISYRLYKLSNEYQNSVFSRNLNAEILSKLSEIRKIHIIHHYFSNHYINKIALVITWKKYKKNGLVIKKIIILNFLCQLYKNVLVIGTSQLYECLNKLGVDLSNQFDATKESK